MTLAPQPGVDRAGPPRHSCLHMNRYAAAYFFAFAGFFAGRTTGGCLDA